MNNFSELCGQDGETFLMRWRGREEGPYAASVIEAKLAANEIGLLHEIFRDGQWVTIRDYLAEREAILSAECRAREEQERRAQEEAERQSKEREEQHRAAALAEERRKNDLLAATLERRNIPDHVSSTLRLPLRIHRGGLILTLGIIGLFVCGPLCLFAWVMGSDDLKEMDAGFMDPSGRSTTATGRNLGIIGTILWIIGVVFFVAASSI